MKQLDLLLSLTLVVLSYCGTSMAQNTEPALKHVILRDSLYNSSQRINLIYLAKENLSDWGIDVVHQGSDLLGTSRLAEDHGALAAINGSFFDMDHGGSVCYFEKDDSVISRNRTPGIKWAVPDSIINAALLLHRDSGLLIEYLRPELHYELSRKEDFVVASGPMLILDSIPQKLPVMDFSHRRHPRTCIGFTGDSVIFITIDGRSEMAAGMSLQETQDLLLSLGCVDAINLDGGGSTTMWIRNKGIVNQPSDKNGERPVANALIIRMNSPDGPNDPDPWKEEQF